LAVVLIQKKNELEASIQGLEEEKIVAQKDAEDAKSSLMSLKGEIQSLKDEKDRMLAQFSSAETKIAIQAQLDGLSVDAEVQALDAVRQHIKTKVAEANLGSELHESDLDVQLAKLRQSSGAITAKQQLEEMKRNKAAQQQATAKTI
jgi:phage shock protein A